MENEEQEINEIEKLLKEQRDRWDKAINKLSEEVRDAEIKKAVDLTATANAYRQKIMSEISSYSMKLMKLVYKFRIIRKAKFEHYATMYQIKVNTTEKNLLIDADTSAYQAKMDMMEYHIEYLRESGKTIDNINWFMKNKLQAYNITGLE